VLDSLIRFVVNVRTLFMVERYKDHLIVTSVTPATDGKYISTASISWQEDGRRGMHSLDTLKDRYDNPDSAMHFALAAAKNWIDDRLEKAG
jgi:hypothetical protein